VDYSGVFHLLGKYGGIIRRYQLLADGKLACIYPRKTGDALGHIGQDGEIYSEKGIQN